MRLLAEPARLDGAGELLEGCVGWQVGEIIFALAGRAMLADDPDRLAGQMLGTPVVDPLGWSVRYPDTDRGEARRQPSFGAATPAGRSPSGGLQHGLRGDRRHVGNMSPTRAPACRDGEDHRHVGRIDLLLERYADRPVEAPFGERPPGRT